MTNLLLSFIIYKFSVVHNFNINLKKKLFHIIFWRKLYTEPKKLCIAKLQV